MGEYSVYCTGKITLPFRPTIAITSLAGYLFLLYHRYQRYTHTIFLPPFDMPLTGRLAKENSARWSADGAEERRSAVYRYCCPKRNRVCTTEERFELINHIWSEDPFTSIATCAGISPGRLCTWVHNYKEMGYIGLIDCRKKWKPKEPHMNKHKHNQPGKHKESEHEELICLRTENKLFKAENAAKKK